MHLVDLFVTLKMKDKMCFIKTTVKIRALHSMQVGPCCLDMSHLV